MDLLLKGGRIVDPARNLDAIGDVLIRDGRVSACGGSIDAAGAEIVDCGGLVVAPGFIDMHVHLREPGFEHKETIASGAAAAAHGGICTVAAMPNTDPPADNAAVIELVRNRGTSAAMANVLPIGCLTKRSAGEELAEIGDLVRAGAVAVSDDGKSVMNAEVMRRAMEYVKAFGIPVISHAEDTHLSADGQMNEGYWSTHLGLRGVPAAAEEAMVLRDMLLASLTGCRLHVAHVSTAGSVRAIRDAKRRGVPVTCEAAPHHFTLTDEALKTYDTNLKVNPPLRGAEDIAEIQNGLADGTIDAVATDHAPHSVLEKEVEFTAASPGILGLETSVGLVLDKLVRPGILPLVAAIVRMSAGPARILSLARKGTLAPGSDGDVTVLDLARTWRVDASKLQSVSRNTAYDGWELTGKAVLTVVAGRIVFREPR